MDGDQGDLRPVGLVILAAGGSTRLGRPKQLLPYRGRSLLRHTAETAVASVCRPVVVVLGAHAANMEGETCGLPVRVVENSLWRQGMATSLRRGLQALETGDAGTAAVVIALCDQPLVTVQVIDALVLAYRTEGRPIIASAYAGCLGVPALFDRSLFPELRALTGDEGARRIITRHAKDVHGVPLPGGALDLDTPEDCERLLVGREA